MNIYWVIHYFVVKMAIFTWDSEPNYRGLKITSERWQNHYVTFTQRLVGLLANLLTLDVFVALCASGDHSKMGKEHVSSFFLPSFQACNSKNIKDILKGSYYALLQSLDFVLGVLLEHALMLGGSKIALFFT